jgi:hypothetical protein
MSEVLDRHMEPSIVSALRRTKPNKAPEPRPWLSRLVLRAARAAPATVVAHLERWARKLSLALSKI